MHYSKGHGVIVFSVVRVTPAHHDAQRFEDVEFTHGAGTVFIQPGIHTHLMEDMSADRKTGRETDRWPNCLICIITYRGTRERLEISGSSESINIHLPVRARDP